MSRTASGSPQPQPHIIEAVVNHVSGHKAGVAGVYNRATYADERPTDGFVRPVGLHYCGMIGINWDRYDPGDAWIGAALLDDQKAVGPLSLVKHMTFDR